MEAPEILVFPRAIFGSAFSLMPWESIQSSLEEIEQSFSWLHRPKAEESDDVVQAIPCVLVRDRENRYCVFRRVREDRPDMSKKLSLIIGGHIDEAPNAEGFIAAVSSNLMREIDEEIGINPEQPPQPVGVIIDGSSIVASRHVAFLHEMVAEEVSTRAPEEFSKRSKFTGEFMDASWLGQRRDEFDPWSRFVIEQYVRPSGIQPKPLQHSFVSRESTSSDQEIRFNQQDDSTTKFGNLSSI